MKQCDILEKPDAACDADEELILKSLKGELFSACPRCSAKATRAEAPRLSRLLHREGTACFQLSTSNLDTGDEGQGRLEPKTLVLLVNTRASPFKCCSQGAPQGPFPPTPFTSQEKEECDLWHRSSAGQGLQSLVSTLLGCHPLIGWFFYYQLMASPSPSQ